MSGSQIFEESYAGELRKNILDTGKVLEGKEILQPEGIRVRRTLKDPQGKQ